VIAEPDERPPPCVLCERTNGRIRRRGLCRSCYRKLRDAGCTLPPRRPTGGAAHPASCRCAGGIGGCARRQPKGLPGLVAYVALWPADIRARLLAALTEAKAA
jgi:hypothetical protein